jgi:hypothetical protein
VGDLNLVCNRFVPLTQTSAITILILYSLPCLNEILINFIGGNLKFGGEWKIWIIVWKENSKNWKQSWWEMRNFNIDWKSILIMIYEKYLYGHKNLVILSGHTHIKIYIIE